MKRQTLVGTPDPWPSIRRGRYQAIADSLRLPLAFAAQGFDRARRLTDRRATDHPDPFVPVCVCGHTPVAHGLNGVCQQCECQDYRRR